MGVTIRSAGLAVAVPLLLAGGVGLGAGVGPGGIARAGPADQNLCGWNDGTIRIKFVNANPFLECTFICPQAGMHVNVFARGVGVLLIGRCGGNVEPRAECNTFPNVLAVGIDCADTSAGVTPAGPLEGNCAVDFIVLIFAVCQSVF